MPPLLTKNYEAMTKKIEEGERMRKAYAPRGERGQGRFSFRLDNELTDWLQQQPNKGRYLNNLIRADMEKQQQHE